ncbi:hypothetical protein TVAG_218940 [Trichomonas vaginalis G3]|uniref:DUF3447 domain-containing protein n=1 Tax=Trichomonas vaginalis (strain ATCC PRA-98 / G3) TaxID=412133 RepID=A2G724_TRIV3|nr:Ankyrin repeat family [Trichomonas vaginalis G3]EAX87037.1 hypothetical protein TVAG_218940 [Trichomonas vaginalis G3]KAI5509053.1 Ankyrin repeat family [Trichomonas vaginalis G3]|eukprot:XP_001299967.1 hypothetical protein [Trichomonas vaginalis G3]
MTAELESVDIPSNAVQQIELQSLLNGLNASNVEDMAGQILNSSFIKSSAMKYELCSELKIIHRIRPLLTPCFSKLIKLLSEKMPRFDVVSHVFEAERPIFHPDIILMHQCFQDGIISSDFVVNFHKHLLNRTIPFALYFAPYIKYFDDYILSKKTCNDDRFQEVFKNYSIYRENDFALLRNYIEYGWKINSLGFYLKYDDAENFIYKHNDMRIDLNTTLYSPFEHILDGQTSIINLAALYGSVSIFKYLIVSYVALPKDLTEFAVIGGNYEIIRICTQSGLDFSSAITAAVEYHRNDILNWLTVQGIAASTFYSSVMKDNLLALIYFISQGFSVDFNENEWSTPLHMAVTYGSSAVIDFLISSGCDWKAVDENGWRPLDLADSEYQKHFINDCINRELLA